MGWGYGWNFAPHMWFGGTLMVLFWIAVIIAIVYIVRSFSRSSVGHPRPGETALDIAKKRYAKGEITKEEFDRLKEDLKE
jgi:putative membrane protein